MPAGDNNKKTGYNVYMSEAVKVYVGMGSNLGNSKQHMVDALKELNELPDTRVTACSSLYSTRPVGPQDQNYFINAVVELETTREAHELLHMLFDIENKHHRLRLRHWGERTMDLDILYYGDRSFNDDELKVPHPEILNRAFVVIPLLEIDPEFTHSENRKLKDTVPELPEIDMKAIRRLSHMENKRYGRNLHPEQRALKAWFKYRMGL